MNLSSPCWRSPILPSASGRWRFFSSNPELLELAHDAIIVRSPSGVVRSWNQGAATLYGWTREEALGKITHLLLKTRFPEPLEEVERKLIDQGEWSGELVHTSRDGEQDNRRQSPDPAAKRPWPARRDSRDQPRYDPARTGRSLPPVVRGPAASAGQLHGRYRL